jgi:hypothetical protein
MVRAPGDSVTLAHPTETRTEADFDFKLCLWRFTFLNRTKPTKYEALEKNAVSRPIVPKIGNLRYSCDPRKPHFAQGFSAYSLAQKPGHSGGRAGLPIWLFPGNWQSWASLLRQRYRRLNELDCKISKSSLALSLLIGVVKVNPASLDCVSQSCEARYRGICDHELVA